MNILLTSVGRRGYLVDYFRDALQDTGRVFASNSEYTVGLQRADGFFLSPLIYDDDYISFLIEVCKRHDISAIISVFDIDLLVLAKAKEQIEREGIQLLLAPVESVEICNDKWRTFLFLRAQGLNTPLTYKGLEDLEFALSSGEVEYPIVIKPRWGMASMGIYFAENDRELEVLHAKSRREVNNSYLKYESMLTPDEDIIFQERLTGQEYGVDVVNDLSGHYVGNFPKSKIHMRAGETDLGQTVSPARFETVSRMLSEKLAHQVVLSVDCFDQGGELFITEMNCRISGHYPLSHLAGVNLPKQVVEWLAGGPTDFGNFRFEEGKFITKDLVPIELVMP